MAEFEVFVGEGKLDLDKICCVWAEMERKNEQPVSINISIDDFECLRKQGNFSVFFDMVAQREILQTGMIGSLFGAQVHVHRSTQITLTSDFKNIYKLKYGKKKEVEMGIRLHPDRALENNKAMRCLEISQRIFPHESEEELESVAVELMYLTNNGIDRILRLLRISNPSNPSFSSISLTKEPVPGTGVVEVMKEVKRENRYSILRRDNAV